MRRLVVIITTFIMFGPLAVAAQEATPTAGEPETSVTLARTDTRYVEPYTPDGLNPSLTVASTAEGACTFDSVMANGRPDAWACTTDGGVVDPCFENPYLLADEATEVACLDTPWSSDVVILTLDAPLAREKEAPGTDPAETVIQPWDLPWALELANGDRCSLLHGDLFFMAGQVVNYGCEQGGMILGETDRGQPVWTVTYLAEGEVGSQLIDVLVAWT